MNPNLQSTLSRIAEHRIIVKYIDKNYIVKEGKRESAEYSKEVLAAIDPIGNEDKDERKDGTRYTDDNRFNFQDDGDRNEIIGVFYSGRDHDILSVEYQHGIISLKTRRRVIADVGRALPEIR